MARALRALGVEFDEVDVDADAALAGRYDELVPLLADSAGVEICHYHLDEAALRARLAVT